MNRIKRIIGVTVFAAAFLISAQVLPTQTEAAEPLQKAKAVPPSLKRPSQAVVPKENLDVTTGGKSV